MTLEAKQRIQLVLWIVLIAAAIRTGSIFYRRHEDAIEAQKQKQVQSVGYSNADYYVNPRKLYPYDLKSAKQLTQQPVWVKEGYRYTYYRYNPASRHVDFGHEAGLLLPIEQLSIQDVVTATSPGPGQQKQVMAVYTKNGNGFGAHRGRGQRRVQHLFRRDVYIQNPRDLYKHWPPDVWQAVENHEIKAGMNELMADFAIGMGIPDAGDSSYSKTVRYPNGGKPLVVVYRDGKAAEIRSGTPGS